MTKDGRDLTLEQNTAQTVFKDLMRLERNRDRLAIRWIWELLQNARDCSNGNRSITCSISYTRSKELVFEHTGKSFTEKPPIHEVAKLVHSGTTKIGESKSIGQFGSGFLATHLLSPEIEISGRIERGEESGKFFKFTLKREIEQGQDEKTQVNKLDEFMRKAWDDYKKSLRTTPYELSDEFSTRFRYPINNDKSDEVATEGLKALRRCAQFVCAFNPEFKRIDINVPEEEVSFEVIRTRKLNDDVSQKITKVTVAKTVAKGESEKEEKRQLIVLDGKDCSICIPLSLVGQFTKPDTVHNVPKLFLGFPLIGTDKFSFPAIINSFNFTSQEDRDGVNLRQVEANRANHEIFEKACELLVNLIEFAGSKKWSGIYRLATIPSVKEEQWVDTKWLTDCLAEKIIEPVREIKAVVCRNGTRVPSKAIIPYYEEPEIKEKLYDLLNDLNDDHTDIRSKLPVQRESVGWRDCLSSWVKVQGGDSFSEMFTVGGLADLLKPIGDLEKLQKMLSRDPVEWLNQLYEVLCIEGSGDDIGREFPILNQAGELVYIDPNKKLQRDAGVDDELKNIAEDLSYSVRKELLDKDLVKLPSESWMGHCGNNDVVPEIIKCLRKEGGDELTKEFKDASVRLFAWITKNGEWEYLHDFPVFSESMGDKEEMIQLNENEYSEDGYRPFAPVKAWMKDLTQFKDLFPPRKIMSPAFFEAMDSIDAWQTLEKKRVVRRDAIAIEKAKFKEVLPDLDQDLHQASDEDGDEIKVTNVAFLTEDKGVIYRVQRKQERAQLFWRFVTEWLIEHDSSALESERITHCICDGEHCYLPARWIELLTSKSWIPTRGRTPEKATTESLGNLLKGSGWQQRLKHESNPKLFKLLKEMNISATDLMLNLVTSTPREREELTVLLMEAIEGNDLPHFIKLIHEHKKRQKIASENQKLGKAVENGVRDALQDEGFTVKRTGVGSDFEILDEEILDGDLGRLKVISGKRSWLLEVKATQSGKVRMSPVQAKTAVEENERFLLCVVPVEDGVYSLDKVKKSMRFVADIGSRLRDVYDGINNLENTRKSEMKRVSQVSTGISLSVDQFQTRIVIESGAWEDGFGVDELAQRLK